MLSGISLVSILLALNCACRAMDHPSMAATATQEKEWVLTSGRRAHRHAYENVTSDIVSVVTDVVRDVDEGELTFDSHEDDEDVDDAESKIGMEKRDRPLHRKRRTGKDRTMMAMLLAYKLKMFAMIPMMVGGLILLKGTTLLAGFFFALFAAVLGLKIK